MSGINSFSRGKAQDIGPFTLIVICGNRANPEIICSNIKILYLNPGIFYVGFIYYYFIEILIFCNLYLISHCIIYFQPFER